MVNHPTSLPSQGTCFLVLLASLTLICEVVASCLYLKAILSHVKGRQPQEPLMGRLLCPKAAFLVASIMASLSAIALKIADFIYVLSTYQYHQ